MRKKKNKLKSIFIILGILIFLFLVSFFLIQQTILPVQGVNCEDIPLNIDKETDDGYFVTMTLSDCKGYASGVFWEQTKVIGKINRIETKPAENDNYPIVKNINGEFPVYNTNQFTTEINIELGIKNRRRIELDGEVECLGDWTQVHYYDIKANATCFATNLGHPFDPIQRQMYKDDYYLGLICTNIQLEIPPEGLDDTFQCGWEVTDLRSGYIKTFLPKIKDEEVVLTSCGDGICQETENFNSCVLDCNNCSIPLIGSNTKCIGVNLYECQDTLVESNGGNQFILIEENVESCGYEEQLDSGSITPESGDGEESTIEDIEVVEKELVIIFIEKIPSIFWFIIGIFGVGSIVLIVLLVKKKKK